MSFYRQYNKYKKDEYDEGFILKARKKYYDVLIKFEQQNPTLFNEYVYAKEVKDSKEENLAICLILILIIVFILFGFALGYELSNFIHTVKTLIP